MAVRDNFSDAERQRLLAASAEEVRRRWPSVFASQGPHYLCENCEFVSPNPEHFHIDHVLPCKRGGTTGRENEAELLDALERGDVERVLQLGVNFMVLCAGCNLSKGAAQFVPDKKGYAWTRPREDKNPDRHRG